MVRRNLQLSLAIAIFLCLSANQMLASDINDENEIVAEEEEEVEDKEYEMTYGDLKDKHEREEEEQEKAKREKAEREEAERRRLPLMALFDNDDEEGVSEEDKIGDESRDSQQGFKSDLDSLVRGEWSYGTLVDDYLSPGFGTLGEIGSIDLARRCVKLIETLIGLDIIKTLEKESASSSSSSSS